jgi:integrase
MYESKVTKWNYKSMLSGYFSIFYNEGTLEEKVEQYFNDKRDYEEDVRLYFSSILSRPPKSVEVMMSMCKTFLADSDIEFPSRFWKELKRKKKGHGAVTLDKVPTQEELRRIVTHLSLDGRAFFLTLASSGMRIGEVLQLRLGDIELSSDPTIVRIRAEYTKAGQQRITFVSSEAKEAIQEWLKMRLTFLKRYRKIDDGRLFPLNYKNMIKQWNGALEKTGLAEKDRVTHWNLFHIHVLRKFFRTQLGTVIPIDIVETLLGHSGYLTNSYRRYSESQLAEFYSKGMASVSISASVKSVDVFENFKMREENARLKQKMNEMSDWIEEMKLTYIDVWEEMRTRVKDETGQDPIEIGISI